MAALYSKSDGYADGLNMYDSSRITRGKIILEGDVFTTAELRYWAITDYIPVSSDRTYEFANYADVIANQDGNKFALFSDKNESSYIVSGSPESFQGVLSQYPDAKYARFSIRQIGPDITSTFSIVQSSFYPEFKGIKNTVVQLEGECYQKSEVIIDDANLYDSNLDTDGFYIAKGSTFTTIESRYYAMTDYLPYDSKREFTYGGLSGGNYTDGVCMAFFSEKNEEAFIAAQLIPSTSSENYGIVPDNMETAKYVRFSLRIIETNDKNTFVYARKAIDFEKLNHISIKDFSKFTINAMGDSYIQLGYDDNRGFMYFGSQIIGLGKEQINSYGIGGSMLARVSPDDNDSTRMVNRYGEMAECDLYTLMGGFNDNMAPFSSWEAKCGSIDTKDDKTTIFGACCAIIEGYKSLYPYSNAIPVMMTYPFTDNDGKILINQTLRDVASYYNIPLIDFEKSCGIKNGFNANLPRPNIADGYTWSNDGIRIDINNGTSIWESSTMPHAVGWSCIQDYIPVPSDMAWWAQNVMNANVLCYDAGKNYIGYVEGRDGKFPTGTVFVRINTNTNTKDSYSLVNIGGNFVNDGSHPNILGFRRMATVWAAKMEELLCPQILDW